MTTPSVVACLHCGGQISADPTLAGQQVACPHCKRHFLSQTPEPRHAEHLSSGDSTWTVITESDSSFCGVQIFRSLKSQP